MNKTLLILKNEFLTVVTRKSFLLTLVLLPLTSFIILLIVSGLQKSGAAGTGSMINNLFQPPSTQSREGFIDRSGLMATIPQDQIELLVRYETEDEAVVDVNASKISAYYVINEDFLSTGEIIYVRPDFNPLGSMDQASSIHALVAYNLTEGNVSLAYRIQDPINSQVVNVSNVTERDSEHWLTFFLPYIVTFLFYIVITTSSSLMLSSVSSEKQNRMMEVLMTSVTPRQMLTGKIIALGLVGLLQTVVWLGAGLLMLRYSGSAFALGSAFQLPVSVLVWGILFFIFGYAVYASLMAGVGALVPNLREASQLTIVVILPMIIPLMFISALIRTPNSPLSVFLSIFPLTSPVSMMTRLSATQVPIWQIGVALLLLVGTAVLLVRASAGLFRAQNLLSGQSLSARAFIKALAGR